MYERILPANRGDMVIQTYITGSLRVPDELLELNSMADAVLVLGDELYPLFNDGSDGYVKCVKEMVKTKHKVLAVIIHSVHARNQHFITGVTTILSLLYVLCKLT